MSCPHSIRRDERTYKRPQPLGRRRMNAEQNDPGLFEWTSTLNGDLPKVLVKRQHDASFGFRQIQQDDVPRSRVIRAGPQNVVALGSKRVNNRLRKVLVGEGCASTPELGMPYIRGPDNWHTTDKRECPLASDQGS